MAKAIEKGIPKLRIEQAALRKQAKIDNKELIIVGLNKYKEKFEENINLLEINNDEVRKKQIQKLKLIKEKRDNKKVEKDLKNIQEAAKNKNKNLLDLCIKAAKNRATLEEISFSIEKEYGRYNSEIKSFSGVFKSKMNKNKTFQAAIDLSNKFSEYDGRRPRILIAKVGQDGHDRGAKIISSSFADIGFDVDIGPLFQTPSEVVKQAIENDVHIIGISSLAGAHNILIKEIILELKNNERNDIIVVLGGVIPKKDYKNLLNGGVSAIFGPGSNINETAITILKILIKNLKL